MKRSLCVLLTTILMGCGVPALSPHERLVSRHPSVTALDLTDPSLYPLVAGYQWRYLSTSRSGNEPEKPAPDQRFTLTQVQTASGSTQAVMDRWYGDRQMPSTLIVRSSDGVTLSRYQHPEQGSITILRFPLVSGATWPGRSWGQASESIGYVGTESVQVPLGTYVAMHTEHRIAYPNGTSDRLHYWYAPGVGMVKAIEGLTIDLGHGPTLNQVTAVLASYGPATGSAQPQ